MPHNKVKRKNNPAQKNPQGRGGPGLKAKGHRLSKENKENPPSK